MSIKFENIFLNKLTNHECPHTNERVFIQEFNNRFANPITNGQHKDSTEADVLKMKERSHVLHELLSGCVQRKDVTMLTKDLEPLFEYVLFVRLTGLQVSSWFKAWLKN